MLCGLQTERQPRRRDTELFADRQTERQSAAWYTDREMKEDEDVWFAERQTERRGRRNAVWFADR